MMKRALLILVAILVILAGIIVSRPDTFSVSRSAIIAAPPAVVYAQVADFAAWQAWSPWGKLDPAMKTTYGGTPGQPGATYAWVGNKDVGEGRMTIVKVDPPSLVDINLEFIKPFPATNDTAFAFAPSGPGTLAMWTMTGHNNFMTKAMSLFSSMDKMIGPDFEKGLAQLKTVSESAATQVAAAPAPSPAPAK